MRVVTLSESRLRDACLNLADSCRMEGVNPDCIVGIRTGGWIVAQEMAPRFPDAVLLPVSLQRPSTAKKKGTVKAVVRVLPRFIQNWLRIIEARVLSILDDGKIPDDSFSLPEEVTLRLTADRPGTILIVDDAIDTGKTMWKVAVAIRNAVPSAVVRTAVITVTTGSPLIAPDFTLYNDRTLIRFPWAIDA